MSNKLQQAITLIKSGDKQNGRQLLAELLKTEPRNEIAWLWMSSVVSNDEQRHYCLKQVLTINPNNQLAQKGLAKLQQQKQMPKDSARPAFESQLKPMPPSLRPELTSIPKSPVSSPAEPQSKALPGAEATAMEPVRTPRGPATPALEDQPKSTLSPKPLPEVTDEQTGESKNVWINPDSLFNKVTVLYDDAIVVANPNDKVLKQIQAEPEKGPPSPEMLGKKIMVILTSSIALVWANKRSKDLNIRYKKGNKFALGGISFATSEARDEFFGALQGNLGPDFECSVKEFGFFRAMIAPIIAMVFIAFMTYLFHGAAIDAAAGAELEITGRHQLLKLILAWLITLIGPTGVLILGALLIALTLFWMFARIQKPPIMMTLAPTKDLAPDKTEPKSVDLPATQAVPALQPEDTAELKQPIKALDKTEPKSVDLPSIQPVLTLQPKDAAELKQPMKLAKPAKPKKQLARTTFVRVILVFLILGAAGCVGLLLMNRPTPGLIEGGMVLDLSNRGLTSVSLRNVPQSNLVLVDLSNNQLTELPPEIGRLSNITSLYIKHNQLRELPPEIGQLSNLQWLILSDNQLTALPPEIGHLTNLEVLDLQGNQLTELPPEIGHLTNLRELNLQRNPLRELPPEIQQIPNLIIYR